MSFLSLIGDLQNKPKEVRMGVFIGLMIFSAIVTFVVFGFSVKGVLNRLEFAESQPIDVIEDEINNTLPSIKEAIKASVLEFFRFKGEVKEDAENIDSGEKLDNNNKGYKLPGLSR